MVGRKSHAQQLRIIEGRVNTKNAGKDFDPRPDLEREERGLPPVPETTANTASDPDRPDDRPPQGRNQESRHNKHRADD